MSRDKAQATAVATVKALRYAGKEYFWINDMQPRMIMHAAKPELDGKDVSELRDPNGKALFRDMVEVVKASGSGYVPYQWAKPGAEQPVDKISYVQGFAPWGWIIGSGVYADDTAAQMRPTMISRALRERDAAGMAPFADFVVGENARPRHGVRDGAARPLSEGAASRYLQHRPGRCVPARPNRACPIRRPR